MADSAAMSIQPAEVLEVSRQLDELAGRALRVMRDEAANLTVIGPARDEVSQRVASTLNEVHQSFGVSANHGLDEMHRIAGTLREHSNNVAALDEDSVR